MDRNSKKVDISYIAKVAGVSLSTVSRALRRDPTASAKTTERIISIANELNYYPNFLAKGLRQRRTQTIGIILNDPNNPFYTEILKVISEILYENNYTLAVSFSNNDPKREKKNISMLLSKMVDGVIISPLDEKSESLNIFRENHIETVFMDCCPFIKDTSYVYTDNLKAGKIAAEYLIKNGHKDILLLTVPYKFSQVDRFEEGFFSTLNKLGIKSKDELIVNVRELSIDSSCEAFKRIVTEGINARFTAVATISDLLAIGIYEVANELRINIPADYSIVGYDNVRFAKALTPPLTTVHQPRRRIGIECANILLNNINNENKIIKNVSFEPYLVERGSVVKIN